MGKCAVKDALSKRSVDVVDHGLDVEVWQGWAIWAAMFVLFLAGLAALWWAEEARMERRRLRRLGTAVGLCCWRD
jgi:K+-transporting ATPase A subunit